MEDLRPVLTTYAYNITGCIDEAKDIVQDVYMKYLQLNESSLFNREAYIKKMVINHAINFKNKHRREIRSYPGQWLPEPVETDTPDRRIDRKEVLSYSMMVLLEKLNARQRAVFILREAYDYDHSEIARLLDMTEENSRQLLARSKKKIKVQSPAQSTPDTLLLQKYLDIMARADISQLEQLLKEDISIVSDGGGKASAAVNPLHGKQDCLAFLSGIYQKFYQDREGAFCFINHLPALCYYEGESLTTCKIFHIEEGTIKDVFILRNPEKLTLLKSPDAVT